MRALLSFPLTLLFHPSRGRPSPACDNQQGDTGVIFTSTQGQKQQVTKKDFTDTYYSVCCGLHWSCVSPPAPGITPPPPSPPPPETVSLMLLLLHLRRFILILCQSNRKKTEMEAAETCFSVLMILGLKKSTFKSRVFESESVKNF